MLKIGNNIRKFSTYSCQPKTKDELKQIIEDRVFKDGPNCDLNDIDVSLITEMTWLFNESEFNGDISDWDVSKVDDMWGMFYRSKFNQDISNWKINKDCVTYNMFDGCPIKDEYKPVI